MSWQDWCLLGVCLLPGAVGMLMLWLVACSCLTGRGPSRSAVFFLPDGETWETQEVDRV